MIKEWEDKPMTDKAAAQGYLNSPPKDGWKTMDSAPKDGTPIKLWSNIHGSGFDYRWREGHWNSLCNKWTTLDGELKLKPTHWMPLPTTTKESCE